MRLETIPQGEKQRNIPCIIDQCGRPSRALNMCSMHYNRNKRKNGPRCKVDGCIKDRFGQGYCSMHYERLMDHGYVGEVDRRIGIFLKGYSAKERKRFHKYGILPEVFQELLALQDYKCALCPTQYKDDQWHLDHDHRCCSGRTACNKCIRGILCHKCNTSLGFVEQNIDKLNEIETYLRSKEKEICG